MVSTYILSVEDFTNRADIDPNVHTSRLKQFFGVVQEKYAKKILCVELYDQLLTEIAADELTTANDALLPYLKDYLIYKTWIRYLNSINAMSTPSGMRTQSDTTSDVASPELMNGLVNQARSDANFYQDELVNFLTCNKDDYPLWRDSQCGCAKDFTRKNNQFSVIGSPSTGNKTIDWT